MPAGEARRGLVLVFAGLSGWHVVSVPERQARRGLVLVLAGLSGWHVVLVPEVEAGRQRGSRRLVSLPCCLVSRSTCGRRRLISRRRGAGPGSTTWVRGRGRLFRAFGGLVQRTADRALRCLTVDLQRAAGVVVAAGAGEVAGTNVGCWCVRLPAAGGDTAIFATGGGPELERELGPEPEPDPIPMAGICPVPESRILGSATPARTSAITGTATRRAAAQIPCLLRSLADNGLSSPSP